MYTFSNKLKTFSIALIILGLLGVGYSFMNSHKTFEDVETMLAEEAHHGGGHGEETAHAVESSQESHAAESTHDEDAHTTDADAHVDEHSKHVEHVQHQIANRPWAALYVAAFFFMMIALGVLAFYAIQWAAQAGWSPVLFRVMEGITAYLLPGALIVLERNNNLDFLTNTGDEMNILVSQPIIESIFFKNSPLHDGAIIIDNNVVKATRVILPVNNEKVIPQRFGLRHRAAIGVTEKTDALALVVSEETGHISYFVDGEFVIFKDTAELTERIKKDLM